MRKICIGLLACFLIGACKSKTPIIEETKFTPIATSEVDASQKNKAYELGKRVLMTCNSSRFKPFTKSEATDEVIKNTTLDRLTKTCQKFIVKYGKFQDIRLVEILQNKKQQLVVYRYKADYQWKHTQKELRVFMNADNKVSAIKSKDWKDEYQP